MMREVRASSHPKRQDPSLDPHFLFSDKEDEEDESFRNEYEYYPKSG
jgi:hypothetical protein